MESPAPDEDRLAVALKKYDKFLTDRMIISSRDDDSVRAKKRIKFAFVRVLSVVLFLWLGFLSWTAVLPRETRMRYASAAGDYFMSVEEGRPLFIFAHFLKMIFMMFDMMTFNWEEKGGMLHFLTDLRDLADKESHERKLDRKSAGQLTGKVEQLNRMFSAAWPMAQAEGLTFNSLLLFLSILQCDSMSDVWIFTPFYGLMILFSVFIVPSLFFIPFTVLLPAEYLIIQIEGLKRHIDSFTDSSDNNNKNPQESGDPAELDDPVRPLPGSLHHHVLHRLCQSGG